MKSVHFGCMKLGIWRYCYVSSDSMLMITSAGQVVLELQPLMLQGRVAETCYKVGVHSISFKCWYRKHIHVVTYVP